MASLDTNNTLKTRSQNIEPYIPMIEQFYQGQIHGTRLFITIHGDDYLEDITKIIQNNREKDFEKFKNKFSFTVPPNTFIIEKSLNDAVVFGNGRDDLENMLFQSQPLWMQTPSGVINKKTENCYGADLPESGYTLLERDNNPQDIPNYLLLDDSYKFIGDEIKKTYTNDLEGQRRILHGTHVYNPGSKIFDKKV